MRGSPVLRVVRAAFAALALAVMAGSAVMAHPHVFVTARSAFVLDEAGKVLGIRHVWTFDEAFSAFAVTDMRTGANGPVDSAKLADLARTNIESLNEFKYFTFLRRGRSELEFAEPAPGYHLEHDGKALTLHFMLPLKEPAPASQPLSLRVDDETIYVAFDFAEGTPVTVEGDKGRCSVAMKRPKKSASDSGLSNLSEDFFNNLKQGFSNDYATTAILSCK